MRTRIATGLLVLALSLGAIPAVLAQQPNQGGDQGKQEDMQKQDAGKDKPQELPLCPVTGEPVNFTVKTMTKDGPVYFCCAACIKKFEAAPAKYAKEVALQRKQLHARDRVQVTCPVTGEPIDKNVFITKGDAKIYFCCAGCKPKYEAHPEKYEAKLKAGYTYQTRCPVMGGQIDPKVFTDLPTGERIYFCCKGCSGKLLKDLQKYAKNLEKQGIRLDVKKLQAALEKDKGGHDTNDGHDEANHEHEHH